MKQALVTAFLLLVNLANLHAQIWGASTQGNFTNEATALAFDDANNVYVTGYITGETAFNANVTFNSAVGNGDIFVAKYSNSGSLIWVKKFGGSMSDRAFDIKVDNNGDILVSGQFFGSVNFGSVTLQSANNSKDIFLLKMNPQGDVLWAISEGGALGDNMYAIAMDQQNNIVLTGQFAGTMNISGQSFVSVMNPELNQPSYDIFVSKYNSNGTPLWAIQGAAKYEDRGMALGTDNQNNIYLVGQFSDTLQFAGQSYNIGFVTKISPNGQIQWFNRLTAGMVLPYDLVVGGDGQVSVCGDFIGNLMHHGTNGVQTLTHDFSKKVFVSTVNTNGQVQWQRALGSENEISARGITRFNQQIYVTGHFKCALTELKQDNTALFNSVGFRDIYMWQLNASGTALQTKQMGGKKNDYAYDIQVNNLGQPFICGSFVNSLFVPGGFYNPISTNNSAFNYTGVMDWFYLDGDESPNAFVSGALHANTPDYNYFLGQPADSLFGYIAQEDTLYFCDSGEIQYNPLTHSVAGPGYNYVWNTNETTQIIAVTNSGSYSVNVSRWDECVSNSDTVYVIIHPTPQMPLLSDDIVQNTNAVLSACGNFNTIAPSIHLCAPDTAMVWFTPIAPGLIFSVTGPQTNINNTNPHPYFAQGIYTATISSDFCTNTRCFRVVHDTIYPKEIDPKPLFVDSNIVNDTLIICYEEWSPLRVIDLLTNPQQDTFLLPTTPVVSELFQVTVNGAPVAVMQDPGFYRAYFKPLITGWYVLNYSLITGYMNTCGVDTLYNQRIDSLYVIVNPLPDANAVLSPASLLCPGVSIFITSSNTYPNFNWYGTSIDWISPSADSIQVSTSGVYTYSGTLTDPITGCNNSFVFLTSVSEKIPPDITLHPQDAIVCPYDSVLMSVPNEFLAYQWTGPSGTNLSITSSHLDAELGFYYCTVLDDEGCYLTSLPAEIKEFATPYLMVEPNNVICQGQQVNITAVFSGTGSVNWLPPLSGTSLTQSINTPGWYSAQLSACGITSTDSILIIDGSFNPSIVASDSLVCSGQSVTLTANISNAMFTWSNGAEGVNQIQVNEPGTYAAAATNDYGCTAQTNSVIIQFVEGSEPPNSYNVSLCEPGSQTLTTNQNLIAHWFDANMNPLDTALTYTQFFNENTTIYVGYPNVLCPANYATIQVNIQQPVDPNLEITGENALCYNQTSTYEVNWTGTISWHLNNTFLSNNPTVTLEANNLNPSNVLSATLENACQSLTIIQEIIINQQTHLSPTSSDTTVCPNSEVYLTFTNAPGAIYAVNEPYTGSNNAITVQVSNEPITFIFYAEDVNGCYSDTATVQISLYISNFAIEQLHVPICVPDTLILTSNANQSVNWNINQNNFTSDTLNFPVNSPDVFYISANYVDSLGCYHEADGGFITVFMPNALLIPDTIVCIGETIYTAFEYTYDNGPVFTTLDSVQIMNSQTINYVVYNNFECPFSGSFQVEAINCTSDFPNVITPNGDGVNDYFVIPTALLEPDNLLIILNRYGQIILNEAGYRNNFRGDNCSDGVYYYKYIPNSTRVSERAQEGFLTILRGNQ